MFETSNQLYHIADTIPLYPHSIFQHWFPDSFSTPGSNDWLLSPHWLVVSVYLDAIVGENPIVGHISWVWLVLYHLLFKQTHLGFFYHLQNDCSLKMYSWIHVLWIHVLSNLEVEPGGSSRVIIYVLHSVKYIYIYISKIILRLICQKYTGHDTGDVNNSPRLPPSGFRFSDRQVTQINFSAGVP